MPAVKLDSKLAVRADDVLSPHAPALFSRLGMRVVGIVELASVERTQPADDEDKEPSVKLRIAHLEVANHDQEPHLREVLRALYLHRTAQGTLDEDGQVELSDRTLELAAGQAHAVEAARMRAGVTGWASYARKAAFVGDATVTDLRRELETVYKGLVALLHGAGRSDREDAA